MSDFDWHSFVRDAATAAAPPEPDTSRRADALALMAPSRLPQRVATPWSAYTLSATGGRCGPRVAVPRTAVARALPHFEPPPFGVCVRCPPGECTCSHGWSLPDACAVAVLRIRTRAAGALHDWFVRYESDPTHLVRVPPAIARLVVAHHGGDPPGDAAALLTRQPQNDVDFCYVATDQFLRQHARIDALKRAARDVDSPQRRHAGRKRARLQRAAPPARAQPDTPPLTCCVCLEPSADARPRCARGTCRAALCGGCEDALRGLCPICDRGANAARFQCAACDASEPLRNSGHPCLACRRNTLCRTCYENYETCTECL